MIHYFPNVYVSITALGFLYGLLNGLKKSAMLSLLFRAILCTHCLSFHLILQLKVAQLEQQYSDLQGTNADIKKHLKDCHALLVAGNIDPGNHYILTRLATLRL